MNTMEEISKEIKKEIVQLGLSQTQLSKKLGYNYTYLNRLINVKRHKELMLELLEQIKALDREHNAPDIRDNSHKYECSPELRREADSISADDFNDL